jgi:hypothetical protein
MDWTGFDSKQRHTQRLDTGSGNYTASDAHVKQQRREADHSPTSSAQADSACVFVEWCLIKYRDNFTITGSSWLIRNKKLLWQPSLLLALQWYKLTTNLSDVAQKQDRMSYHLRRDNMFRVVSAHTTKGKARNYVP